MENTHQNREGHNNDQRNPGSEPNVKDEKAHNRNPAQGAEQSNTPEQAAQPELTTSRPGKNNNPTTGKGSVEQDDEDVGGDQDRTPDPEIVPAVDKDG